MIMHMPIITFGAVYGQHDRGKQESRYKVSSRGSVGLLRWCGVKVEILQNTKYVARMRRFVVENLAPRNDDIGVWHPGWTRGHVLMAAYHRTSAVQATGSVIPQGTQLSATVLHLSDPTAICFDERKDECGLLQYVIAAAQRLQIGSKAILPLRRQSLGAMSRKTDCRLIPAE